ncbi:MAG: site-specific integrase [Evtepia sp.]
MRRTNGTGQIIKLSGKRRRPFAIRFNGGNDPQTGKVILKYISYHETYQEAEIALVDYWRDPKKIEKASITLQTIFDEWSTIKYKNLDHATKNNYDSAWNYLSKLSHCKVKDIRTGQLQEIIDTATYRPPSKKGEPLKDERPLGRSGLEKIKAVATMLFDYAVQNDIIDRNYAKYIQLPRTQKIEKECFSEPEVLAIEKAAAQGVPFADVVLVMCYTGFRIEELLTLTPFSYDTKLHTLTGGLKTDAGRDRVVPVGDKILPIIDRWLKKGGSVIFCRENGTRYAQGTFRKTCYYSALEAAGVRRLTPHATRHTFASRLATAGVDSVTIQKLMGHADYAVTANTYTHVDVATLKTAVNQL